MKNSFFKGHGLGNEYIVLDPAELTFPMTPSRIARICDREQGIGSDGVLTVDDSNSADFGVRIWNPDGSEAENSGNGLRIFACYLHATSRTLEKSFTVETPGGIVCVETQQDRQGAVNEARTVDGAETVGAVDGTGVAGKAGAVCAVGGAGAAGKAGAVCAATVHMGRATFNPEALPCTLEVDELIEQQFNVAGETLTFTGVSVGNPHCVVFHPRGRQWSRDDLLQLGPTLETNPIFPKKTNVQLAEPIGTSSIRILIWERGAGETSSSGSSACAAASAAIRLGLVTSPVTVESAGGALLVDVDEKFTLMLTGPVAEIARGTFSELMLRRILDTDHGLQTT